MNLRFNKMYDRTASFKRKDTCSACARCEWSCGQSSADATKYATRTVIMYDNVRGGGLISGERTEA